MLVKLLTISSIFSHRRMYGVRKKIKFSLRLMQKWEINGQKSQKNSLEERKIPSRITGMLPKEGNFPSENPEPNGQDQVLSCRIIFRA